MPPITLAPKKGRKKLRNVFGKETFFQKGLISLRLEGRNGLLVESILREKEKKKLKATGGSDDIFFLVSPRFLLFFFFLSLLKDTKKEMIFFGG